MANLQEVLSYRHQGVIEKLQTDHGMEAEVAEALFVDMLRFLFICGCQNQGLRPTKPIDIAWHEFILFTPDYHRLCERFFGRYLHHRPGGGSSEDEQRIAREKLLTLARS